MLRRKNLYLSRALLQFTVVLLAMVPIGAGLSGVLSGMKMTGDALSYNGALDSHVRYLSGILLAIGLGFWSAVPAIERKEDRFLLLTALVFIGGLGRLIGVILHGWPPGGMVFGLVMELIITPLLCLWQASVARAGHAHPDY